MAPDNTPDWMRDRGQLWNAVEKAEKRKDSQLARSIDIALPYELSLEQNLELVRGFVEEEQYVDRGMIADIRHPRPRPQRRYPQRPRHILLTTREIAGPASAQGAGLERQEGTSGVAQGLGRPRESHSRTGGFEERIDHRSLVGSGHRPRADNPCRPAGKQMEQRGKPSDRAQKNRDIKAANDNMAAPQEGTRRSENAWPNSSASSRPSGWSKSRRPSGRPMPSGAPEANGKNPLPAECSGQLRDFCPPSRPCATKSPRPATAGITADTARAGRVRIPSATRAAIGRTGGGTVRVTLLLSSSIDGRFFEKYGVRCRMELLDKPRDVGLEPCSRNVRSHDAPVFRRHAHALVEVTEHDRFLAEAALLEPMGNKY
jgi:hypothetical protein